MPSHRPNAYPAICAMSRYARRDLSSRCAVIFSGAESAVFRPRVIRPTSARITNPKAALSCSAFKTSRASMPRKIGSRSRKGSPRLATPSPKRTESAIQPSTVTWTGLLATRPLIAASVTGGLARQRSLPFSPCFVDGLPAVPCRHRAIGPEPLALALELLRRQQIPQAIGQGVALAHPVVADRPDVEPAKLENQEHFGGPSPDTPDDRQPRDDFLIGEGADPIGGDRAVGDFSCEVPDRGWFVARESHRAKSRRAERQHGLWGKVPIEERDEPAMDGGRRRAG